MKLVLLCLLIPAITACSPFQETEEEAKRRLENNPTPTATSTPKLTPKPGAWMTEKRDNPLGTKGNPLDRKSGK